MYIAAERSARRARFAPAFEQTLTLDLAEAKARWPKFANVYEEVNARTAPEVQNAMPEYVSQRALLEFDCIIGGLDGVRREDPSAELNAVLMTLFHRHGPLDQIRTNTGDWLDLSNRWTR